MPTAELAPPTAPARGSHYTGQEIERALLAVALFGGNVRRASRELEAQGLRVPYRTLFRWTVETFPDCYEDVRTHALPRIRAELDRQHLELAQQHRGRL